MGVWNVKPPIDINVFDVRTTNLACTAPMQLER
jgi:hypothetical protein